jgi:sulfide:quinone oxidoreductase
MTSPDRIGPHRVVIVGGGIAALEAVLALHELADNRVRVTVIAPEPEFVLPPQEVAWPFTRGHRSRLPLEGFMGEHGGSFRRTATLSVDAELRTVRCATGPDEPYDALIIAVGASARTAFEHALTFGADFLLNGLLAELEQADSRGVAFVVPRGCTWPLPLYEFALMTADEVRRMRKGDVQLHLVTSEEAPLDVFGPEASAAVAELLQTAGVTLHSGANADVRHGGHVEIGSGEVLDVAHVVALPVLHGPRLVGLPSDANGFIPVDEYGRVIGVDAVYVAGDAADRPIKQGGLACQQAAAVAAHVAAVAGAPVDPTPYAPVLRGRLLAGHTDLGWRPLEVSGGYLAPYLEAEGLIESPPRDETAGAGVDVRLSRSAGWSAVQSVSSRRSN